MIKVVDYGLGNVRAFLNVYAQLNIPAQAASTDADFNDARGIIVPGVGAFDHAARLLEDSGLTPTIREVAESGSAPILGVCVGMQLLSNDSEEGELPGLGWIPGRVRHFTSSPGGEGLPVPHMGWNDVKPTGSSPLFEGLRSDARFYFLHSYYFDPSSLDNSSATAQYGGEFTCAVEAGSVFGVQFHPEKSHHWGQRLLFNFARVSGVAP